MYDSYIEQRDTKEVDGSRLQTNVNLHMTLKCECLYAATVPLRTGEHLAESRAVCVLTFRAHLPFRVDRFWLVISIAPVHFRPYLERNDHKALHLC